MTHKYNPEIKPEGGQPGMRMSMGCPFSVSPDCETAANASDAVGNRTEQRPLRGPPGHFRCSLMPSAAGNSAPSSGSDSQAVVNCCINVQEEAVHLLKMWTTHAQMFISFFTGPFYCRVIMFLSDLCNFENCNPPIATLSGLARLLLEQNRNNIACVSCPLH